MANHKSAVKRNRQSLKRRARNLNVREGVKDAVKKVRAAIVAKDPAQAAEALKAATKTLSKAGAKGVLHKRTASRRVSRLAKATARAQ